MKLELVTLSVPRPAPRQLLLAGAAGGLLGASVGLTGWIGIAFAGLVAIGALFFLHPAAAIALLLLSRSSLDWFALDETSVPTLQVNPAAALGLLLIAMAAVLVGSRLLTGRSVDWGGAPAKAWGVWLLAAAFALGIGGLRHGGEGVSLGVREIVRLSTFLAIYLLVVNGAKDRAGSGLVLAGVVLGLAIPAAVGIRQLATGDVYHNVYGIRRISSTFVHPNPFAAYLSVLCMTAAGLLSDWWGRPARRFVLFFVLGVGFTLLVFTYTRSFLLVFVAALVVWAAMGPGRRRAVVWGGLVLAAIPAVPLLTWRFRDLVDPTQAAGEPTNSLLWRLMNYRELIGAFQEHPIFGSGLKTVVLVNPVASGSLEGSAVGAAAHNELLRILVEQGIVGAALYVVLAIVMLRGARTLVRRQPPASEGGLPALGQAVFAMMLVLFALSAIAAEFLSQTVVLYVLFALLGVLHVRARRSVPPA